MINLYKIDELHIHKAYSDCYTDDKFWPFFQQNGKF